MNRRDSLKKTFAMIFGGFAALFLPKRAEATYKEDSNFPNVVPGTDKENPIDWEPKKFKYTWLELWVHSGTIKVGIVDLHEPTYWQGLDSLISGPVVVEAGIGWPQDQASRDGYEEWSVKKDDGQCNCAKSKDAEMSVEKEIIERLETFTKRLESGKPIKATRVRRVNTPDGPMHLRKKVTLRRRKK